jgi:protocatechuate 3,4-dioxygenase beta subunit
VFQLLAMMTRRHLLRAAVLGAVSAVIAACSGKTKVSGSPTPSDTGSPTPTGTATATPNCVVRPALTEGPYFVDERLNRSDIRTDPSDGSTKPGAQLRLVFNVSQVIGSACTTLPGAQVDVWHCDAGGLYSDQAQNETVGKKFLRGYQLTDAGGRAEFVTIVPGWYRGRAVHIHFKIRMLSGTRATYEFTSQLFFDDATLAEVLSKEPYSSRGNPDTPNASDGIYQQSGGQLTLTLAREGSGYAATFDIGLQTA